MTRMYRRGKNDREQGSLLLDTVLSLFVVVVALGGLYLAAGAALRGGDRLERHVERALQERSTMMEKAYAETAPE